MAKPFTVSIDSILNGHSPTTNFAGNGQFRASLGIDPAQPIDDNDTAYSTIASGVLRPSASEKFSGSTIESSPLWIKTNPKNSNVYVLDAKGSTYTIDATLATVSGVSDAGELTNGLGNGFEYYDNYMYASLNTTIARIGPLNGVQTVNGNYWSGTLSKAILENTAYPTTFKNNLQLPNHVLHRHSDGVLYIADVVSGQGYVHTIQTTKTTVEGDTDDGSTYGKLAFGYGLYPTAMESYGSDLAVALFEGTNVGLRQKHAKLAFWDTTSASFNKITWVEFPDPMITAMKNVNGTLFTVSGSYKTQGFRVCQFIGGYSFQEVYYSETGEPCLQGAIDAVLNRVVFGNHTNVPESDGCVNAIGLQKSSLSKSGMFNIMRATGGNSSTSVTSVCFADATGMGFSVPIIGWSQAGDGSTGVSYGLDKQGTAYNNAPSVFWSEMFRIGDRFKIKKIRIPLSQAVGTNMTLVPTLYFDDGTTSKTLATISSTTFSGKKSITIRPDSATGENNFWLQLKWTGSALCTVGLPIVIDGEIIEESK